MTAPLFHQDLREQMAALESLKEGVTDLAPIEKALRNLGGGARLLGFMAVYNMTRAMEETLKKGTLPRETWEQIERAKELLKSLAEAELSALTQVVETKKEAFNNVTEALGKLPQAAPVAPPRPTPGPTPAPTPAPTPEVHFDTSMME